MITGFPKPPTEPVMAVFAVEIEERFSADIALSEEPIEARVGGWTLIDFPPEVLWVTGVRCDGTLRG
jgi:hypothetical protein